MPIILSIIGLVIVIIVVIILKSTNFITPKSKENAYKSDKQKFSKKDKDIIDLVSQLSDLLDKLEQ